MRVNHGFIADRRRLYGKHVRGLSSITAPSHREPARARAHVTVHIFRHLNAEGGSFNTDIISLSYSLSATFPDADLPPPSPSPLSLFLSLCAYVQWRSYHPIAIF